MLENFAFCNILNDITFTFLPQDSYFNKAFKLLQRYPSLVRLTFGYKSLIVTDNPDVIQKILTSPKCLDKMVFYEFLPFEKSLFRLESEFSKIIKIIILLNKHYFRQYLETSASTYNSIV